MPCTPLTCSQQNADCGVVPDGCGGSINCGTCPAGKQCGGGGPNRCGSPSCTPKTCVQAGLSQCGSAPDGCGGTLHCGTCEAGYTECVGGKCLPIGGGSKNSPGSSPETNATPHQRQGHTVRLTPSPQQQGERAVRFTPSPQQQFSPIKAQRAIPGFAGASPEISNQADPRAIKAFAEATYQKGVSDARSGIGNQFSVPFGSSPEMIRMLRNIYTLAFESESNLTSTAKKDELATEAERALTLGIVSGSVGKMGSYQPKTTWWAGYKRRLVRIYFDGFSQTRK